MFETPIHLLVFFVVTVLLLYAPYYLDTKTRMQQAILNFQLFLFLLPVIFLLFIHLVSSIRDPNQAVAHLDSQLGRFHLGSGGRRGVGFGFGVLPVLSQVHVV
ncbi:hypothetical protein Acr_21g0010170 [Actinidia rufa]|uniref:Uncharacterized protein n=1 Tax=Actinidia rufa TaxID=165716 RepID=A0A7J0GI62_9ERIC|nr:hypothetical protein Acr_21g0010170 [Actinidia rufa]